jgi:molybdopterin-containing oxidoreductase family iron-sulfur binding subunit
MSEMIPGDRLDLEALRRHLAGKSGATYWRSLEELAGTPAFREFLHREFPAGAAEWDDPAGRRQFLKIMGASLALAGLAGCTRQPEEKIVPYVRQPEDAIPGKPVYYATAISLDGYATGVLVESHQGRPTKIEGNPSHPASLGATDAFTQADILNLYDPDRAQTVTRLGEIQPYGEFLAALKPAIDAQKLKQGSGLRILTGTVTSPSLARQLRAVLELLPAARWHQYDPAGRDNVRAGARLACGRDIATRYQVERADVILALDSDFLTSGPGCVPYARAFAQRRRPGA